MLCLANPLEHHSLYYGLLNKNKVYVKLLCVLVLFTVSEPAPQVTVFEQRKSIVWQVLKVKLQATRSVDAGKSKKIQSGDLFWNPGCSVD